MKRMLIRYKTKPDKTAENEALIRRVFQELHAEAPDAVRYLAMKVDDGTFVHLVSTDAASGPSPIVALKAFQSFQQGIKDRCLDPPQSGEVTVVGNYRMLAE